MDPYKWNLSLKVGLFAVGEQTFAAKQLDSLHSNKSPDFPKFTVTQSKCNP